MKSQRASKPKSASPVVLLNPSNPADLQPQIQKVQLAIAFRAHELFEARGRAHGHDLEDWFRAESELLRPVSVSISESEDRINVRADIAGFDQTEIEVAVEPSRIMILGKKKTSGRIAAGGEIEPTGLRPDQILEIVDLATEVIPERAVATLQTGVLKFEVPTAAKRKTQTAA